jgi:hypothetical protein
MVICNVNLNRADTDAFVKALEAYAGVRATAEGGSKTFGYALNRTAKDVAFLAAKHTHRANASQLRTMLGQSQGSVRTSKKTGRQYVVRPKAKATNDAGAVLASRMALRGKNPRFFYTHDAWVEKVRKFVGRTLRSVNFMRSGWLHSARTLARLVKEQSAVSSQEAFGRRSIDERGEFAVNAYDQNLGECYPAHSEGNEIVVEIANKSVNPRNATSWSKGLGLYGAAGLERAMSEKAADMMVYVEDVANQRAKEFGLA